MWAGAGMSAIATCLALVGGYVVLALLSLYGPSLWRWACGMARVWLGSIIP